MEVDFMSFLSIIIKREKITNKVLYMLKNRIKDIEPVSLEHTRHLYNLAKLFSSTGFNIELDEPKYVNLTKEQIIKLSLEDIGVYTEIIKKNDPKINEILSELVKIKVFVIEALIFREDMKEINLTKEELVRFDGREGRPAYIAIDNKVYDITCSPIWDYIENAGNTPGSEINREYLNYLRMGEDVISELPVIGNLVP